MTLMSLECARCFTHCENLLVESTVRHGLVSLLAQVMKEMSESMQEDDLRKPC